MPTHFRDAGHVDQKLAFSLPRVREIAALLPVRRLHLPIHPQPTRRRTGTPIQREVSEALMILLLLWQSWDSGECAELQVNVCLVARALASALAEVGSIACREHVWL